MADEGDQGRVDLSESAQPKAAADESRGEFSANPKGAVPELLEKSMQPKAPNVTGTDEASVQPVSALPDTERSRPQRTRSSPMNANAGKPDGGSGGRPVYIPDSVQPKAPPPLPKDPPPPNKR